jgi:uncharacterized repeat protein (TIGR03803 family)
LYGLTLRGGLSRGGTAFKLNTNGTGYTNLWAFDVPAGSGDSHHAGLSQGTDGMLYGTISSCRSNTVGAVFKLSTNGGDLVMLHSFTTNNLDGQIPDARLLEGANGELFGTTVSGGANGSGTLFKINRDGSDYTVLHSFGGVAGDGQWPSDVLSMGSDGSIYGSTLFGGACNEGALFKVGPDGNGYSVLKSFSRVGGDGEQPQGRLICGQDGSFYGTTIKGGSNDCGTVFKLNPTNGTYALLHDFTGDSGDGEWPLAGLVQAADGAVYGTTSSGGDRGFGTVFKLNSDGFGYTVLYSFAALPDGNLPSGNLLQGADGFLYGVTGAGGSNDVGTVFKLGTNGTGYSLLHTFTTNGNDAWGPVGGLAQGDDGTLYGTTADNGTNGVGTVYKLNPDGTGFTVLHSFLTTALDGWTPYAGLLLGQNGTLYGTTRRGGQANMGAVFSFSSDGSSYTVLRNFSNLTNDGREPFGELLKGNDGILYGTTFFGGSTNDVTNDLDRGSVFQLSTNGGCYLTLQGFSGGPNGANLSAGVFQDRDGFLYGSSELGGSLNAGTIFKLGVGPTIFVQPQDQSVALGGKAAFSVTATGGGSLNYQWLYNGLPLSAALDSALSLTNVVRTNAGVYSVRVTNAVGTALSSNGTLTVQVPQLLSRPAMSGNGSFQLTAAYTDGWALQPDDLARFEAQASSNLLTWTTLPNSLTWSNGLMVLSDPGVSNQPVRFYRILEH